MSSVNFTQIHDDAYKAAQQVQAVPQNGYVETAIMAITALKMLKKDGAVVSNEDERTNTSSAKFLIAQAMDKKGPGHSYDSEVNAFLNAYNTAVNRALGISPGRDDR